ncbi:MAG: DNA repair protein RecN [Clostridiales bacterium]|nr:DNA repair protein RecN [Clostridiales bacterium]
MIREISIQNIALIDELTISFEEGFNVLTGETGAGKSIIIDSVNLALGERADRELIQTGKNFARVDLLFQLTNDRMNETLTEYGIPPEEDGSLLLMRELSIQGRNLCKVNGRSVTLTMLREISRHLVDVHGQHQHQSLLTPESHVEFLDRLGGSDLEETMAELHLAWSTWQVTKKEINKLQGWSENGERRSDILKYQIDEIDKAALKSGEEESIRKERSILAHAEKIASSVAETYELLYSGNKNASSVIDGLSVVVSQLKSIQGIDENLDTIIESLESIQYTLEDSVHELRFYRDSFEYDPDRLEMLDDRLELLLTMKRKYGASVEDVIQLKGELESELDLLENSQEKLEALQKQSHDQYLIVLKCCRILSQKRKKAAQFLEKQLTKELVDLNMGRTLFQVNMSSPDHAAAEENDIPGISKNGYDNVEFLISPNLGEPLKPLAKIISGGEMSRLMLAFKTILGDLDEIPTMIFDEIDVGISGRTAQKVAEKIGGISRNRQVICVTHLPQIASMADCHFVIEKKISEEHTRTHVSKLDIQERKEEIARMIGGSNLTTLSLEHAGELIKSAIQQKTEHSI